MFAHVYKCACVYVHIHYIYITIHKVFFHYSALSGGYYIPGGMSGI